MIQRPLCSVEVLKEALGGEMLVPVLIEGEDGVFRINPARTINGVVHLYGNTKIEGVKS